MSRKLWHSQHEALQKHRGGDEEMTIASADKNSADALTEAASLISNADASFIGAAAGMGVASGLATFQDPVEFWRDYPLIGKEKTSYPLLVTGELFKQDPVRGWWFFAQRIASYRRSNPHEGDTLLKCWIIFE